uniref:HlyD family efflux transporter periplasmic adaptor subunit n=1 Tax=Agathobacter sp. TaxID=2021311 RepID=UPI0040564D54
MSKKRNVVKFRNPLNINIGFIIFLIIIIYVIFNIYSYFTQSHIAKYEVRQGSIASNHTFQGIIYRDETVAYAEQAGYINYYVKNASKVSVHDVVYSIDTLGNIAKEISGTNYTNEILTPEMVSRVTEDIDNFLNTYDSVRFSEVYSFYNDLNSEILHTVSTNALSDLSNQVQTADGTSFFKAKSPSDGIIVFQVDGYEGKTADTFTTEDLNTQNYKKNILTSNTEVSVGDPVYKRINSEHWNIILPITEALATQLSDGSHVTIRFCKDDYTTSAAYTILKEEGSYYLNLSLQRAMIRYVNERFIDIELLLNDDTGLKIPKSAITSKEFFTIPKEYFNENGSSSSKELLIRADSSGEENTVKVITPTIYYESETHYYIDNEKVSEGDIIVMSDSINHYTIGSEKDSLIGVYNVNKGYAVFKQIRIIYENEEYAIVDTKTDYGIALYDHIALEADKIKENQLTVK